METIRAIYENGVFKPKNPVSLPEASEVVFEPRLVTPSEDPDVQAGLFHILARRYRSGEHDVAERHDEHQP